MFRQFWDRKRHVIEATSIVVALGTLFLTIPSTKRKRAGSDGAFLLTVSLVIFGVNCSRSARIERGADYF
jgi:hypothetical protein